MAPELTAAGPAHREVASDNGPNPADPRLQLTLIRHSLGWLVAANLVGVWLALVLVWPAAGRAAGPLTYGRWMPLHTDWMLYGWSALPLVALFCRWLPAADRRHERWLQATIVLWSTVLAISGLAWLDGQASGKLFLSAAGGLRLGLPLTLSLLWAGLGANLWHRRAALAGTQLLARGGLLAALLPVPALLWWAGDPRVYPAFNPDSGGATGAALLGSTLAVLGIIGLLPWALRLPPGPRRGPRRVFSGYLLFSAGVYAAIDHGNVSHHHPAAVAGLATLLGWFPLLEVYLASFAWPASPLWRRALIGWWTLLAASGFVFFLPGWSERLKFTNGLVAHAHLAMAGFSTALGCLILQTVAPGPLRAALEDKRAFFVWQGGTTVYVLAALAVGWREGAVPGVLFQADETTDLLYAVRLLAGAAMAAVSAWWFQQSLQPSSPTHAV